MSDLTPEETLRRSVHRETPDGGDVSLQDALAAVAAERERCGERLLSDEAVEAGARANRETDPDLVGWDAIASGGQRRWLAGERAALSAAWRVVTGDTTPHGGTPAHEREARP